MGNQMKPITRACRSALLGGGAAAAALMFSSAPALGQGGQLEEVIVTSTYREESLQDIPIAVTALNGDLMTREDIVDLTGISLNTPNFSFTEFAPGQTIPVMRGIGLLMTVPVSTIPSPLFWTGSISVGVLATISRCST